MPGKHRQADMEKIEMTTLANIQTAVIKTQNPEASDTTIRGLARKSGLLYAILAFLGMFSVFTVESLIVAGDASATVEKITDSLGLFGTSLVTWVLIVVVDVAVSVLLYLMLENVNRPLALTVAAFRLVYSAMVAAMLLNLFDVFQLLHNTERAEAFSGGQIESMVMAEMTSFSTGFLLALIFFGIHLVLIGKLFRSSSIIPGFLAGVLMIAGFGYIADSMLNFFVNDYNAMITAVLMLPAIIGEFGLAGWLIFKGPRSSESTEGAVA